MRNYATVRERNGRAPSAERKRSDHRRPVRQGGAIRKAAIDPQGYDAGKKDTCHKRHILVDTLGLVASS